MKNYIRYDIQKRKYSANVIIGIYEHLNDKNEVIEKSDIILCPTLKKEDGDIIVNNVCNFLNNENKTISIK